MLIVSLVVRISMSGVIMSNLIDTVSSLMPSSSKFKGSDVQTILDSTIGPYFDDKESVVDGLVDAPFLTEASGDLLDLLHGRLYGVNRNSGEDDDDYRTRLTFQARDHIKVEDLEALGCGLYAHVDSYSSDYKLTSRNTALTGKLMIEFPSESVEELVKDNLIWQGWVTVV